MSLKVASGRSFAKVILLGEHAVVHGIKAVAMSLSRGACATVEPSGGPFTLEVPSWHLTVRPDDGTPNAQAIAALSRVLGIALDGAHMTVDTDIPSRSGLGASAAVAAAAARALVAATGGQSAFDTLFAAVQASEKVFHGNPSGLDAAVALRGGIISFSKSEGIAPIDAPVPPLLIAHSGAPGETHRTVARFADRLRRAPDEAAAHLRQISALVDAGIAALTGNDLERLGEVMNRNHEHLAWFGVSSPSLDHVVATARRAGAWGAKLTGGGGGGCAIALVPENRAGIRSALEREGFTVIDP